MVPGTLSSQALLDVHAVVALPPSASESTTMEADRIVHILRSFSA